MKRILKWIGIVILSVGAFLILYLMSAYGLGAIACNRNFIETPAGVELFIKSNGVHTDLVLPIQNDQCDWRTLLDTSVYFKEKKAFEYVSVGWGDKGFYLETPTWADLKFSTAFKAMFCQTPTAMHITLLTKKPVVNPLTRKVCISREQYEQLVRYIKNSFDTDEKEKVYLIDCCHYAGVNDQFYEAKGSYSLFFTCNSWANDALKKSGIRTSLWTPFDKSILSHFK